MQLFPCPFCGRAPETEFTSPRRPARPGRKATVPDARVVALSLCRRNPRGPTREIWVHLTCGEFFVMERDTLTHAVKSSAALREASMSARRIGGRRDRAP